MYSHLDRRAAIATAAMVLGMIISFLAAGWFGDFIFIPSLEDTVAQTPAQRQTNDFQEPVQTFQERSENIGDDQVRTNVELRAQLRQVNRVLKRIENQVNETNRLARMNEERSRRNRWIVNMINWIAASFAAGVGVVTTIFISYWVRQFFKSHGLDV